ncbi:MAG: alpha/beta hydrolase [Chloroflexota bacterium]
MSKIRKSLAYGIGGLAGIVGLGALHQAIANQRDLQRYPPPGKLIDVGGYSLHIKCMGKGFPAVVLDSGLSHNGLVWSLVQPEVARFTQVCSYDRAGYGWSDAGPRPRTCRQIAYELHTLLQNVHIAGPYVVVGHSFGGMNIRVFADMYPDDVVGLVLVDAAHEDQRKRMPQAQFRTRLIQDLQWQWFRLNSLWARLGIWRLRNQPFGVIKELPSQLQAVATALGYRSNAYDWVWGEAGSIPGSEKQVRATGSLGDLPLTVLSAHMGDEMVDQYWQALQADLAQLSSNATHIVAEKGGHNLHIDEPELVVDAIQVMVEAIRENQQQ